MVTRLMIRQFTTKLSETAATTKTSRARGQARLLDHAELLGLRVQTRDCIGLDLVDPHRTCRVHGDGVRAAVLPGRKRVLLDDLPGDGIDAHELAVTVLRHPE